MSNVLYFQQAMAARDARNDARDAYATDPLGGFGHAGMGAVDDLVYRVQRDLTRAAARNGAFNPKGVDGLWGPNTKAAIMNFRAAVGLTPDPGGSPADYMDGAFLSALAKAVAGAPAAPAGPTQPGTAITVPPGALTTLPMLEAAKQWLLAPGQPVYKKPVLWVGVGVVALTILLAMRSRD